MVNQSQPEREHERELVDAVEDALSCLGKGGYIPTIGAPRTERLRRALEAYGVVPDYGRRFR